MNKTNQIVGACAATALVIAVRGTLTNKPIAKPVLGVGVATLILTGLDAIGMGVIAAPMALLVAITVIGTYALDILGVLEKL